MKVDLSNLDAIHKRAFYAVNEFLQWEDVKGAPSIFVHYENGLTIKKQENSWHIYCDKLSRFTRALGLISEYREEKDGFILKESPAFKELGVMIDCSRNAVPRVHSIQKMLHLLALMGYTYLQLYTEDTYKIEEYSYFGYFRGRYTKEELREIDIAAEAVGIELIPCIQTLAHLKHVLKWAEFSNVQDINDILLVGEPETYQLIDNMFKNIKQSFRSKRINIGMDEAYLLGLGEYLNRNGYCKATSIMQQHLNRIKDIAKKYDLNLMIWSDMYFQSRDGFDLKEISQSIPSNISLIYWNYYTLDQTVYDEMLKKHQRLNCPVIFAGGAWKWSGYTAANKFSIQMADIALDACKKNHIENVFVTAWGDNGAEASIFSVLPTLVYWAEKCYRDDHTIEEILPKRFETVTGEKLDDFYLLEAPLFTPDNPEPGQMGLNPPKYYLYQDVLLGLADCTNPDDTFQHHFTLCRDWLLSAACRSKHFSLLYKEQAALCDVLIEKATAGVKIRRAYQDKNIQLLREYATKYLPDLADKIEKFHHCVQERWLKENKAFGLEVLDIRLGGVKERVLFSAKRIFSYVEGEIDQIEELEEKIMEFRLKTFPGNPLSCVHWEDIVTANSLVGF